MDCGEGPSTSSGNSSNSIVIQTGDVFYTMELQGNNGKENVDPNISEQPLDLSMKKPEPMPAPAPPPTTKRGRKVSDTVAPRRNPKRQTQLSKQGKQGKLFEEVPKLEDTFVKPKKPRKSAKKVRFAARNQGNCGAVYSPPSPIRRKHLRSWPTEGMHEKPEYDPTTGTVEPLDHLTRSIAENYNKWKLAAAGETGQETAKTPDSAGHIDVVSHIVLHRVIAYAASALQLQKREKEANLMRKMKKDFLDYFGLTKNKDGNDEEEFKKLISCTEVDVDEMKRNLKELLKNAMIKYCITNDVDQHDLVMYIDSLSAEDIIKMSKEEPTE